jgi:hypothetical protein
MYRRHSRSSKITKIENSRNAKQNGRPIQQTKTSRRQNLRTQR